MRLFTAVQFDDAAKNHIDGIQDSLRSLGRKGNFTQKENLHLTLVFIGETPANRIDSIQGAMNEVDMQSFVIELSGLGYFKRDGGDLWWLGVKENKSLTELYNNLASFLRKAQVSVESRPYKPHLTLVREFIAADPKKIISGLGKTPEISVAVNKISLMKSERLAGKLVYTEIYAKELQAIKGCHLE